MDGRFERLAFLYDSIEADLSSMPCRQDGEFLSIGEAVGGEVVVVDREDDGEAFAGSKVDQGGVGEIHGAVGVLSHEGVNFWQFFVGDNGHPDCAGTQQRPNSTVVAETAPDKMESLGEDSLCGQPG